MRHIATIIMLLILARDASGQTFRLRVSDDRGNEMGKATACCVGHLESGGSVLVTTAHNFREGRRAEIWTGGRWELAKVVERSEAHDVAVLELPHINLRSFRLADSFPSQRTGVVLGGFGAEYCQTGEVREFEGQIASDMTAVGLAGEHSIPGDSGGFCATTDEEDVALLHGLIVGFENPNPRVIIKRRSDGADQRLETILVPASKITLCLQRRYRVQCPPQGCPIYIRPQVQQPYFGPIPIGPPKVVGVVDPLPTQPVQPQLPLPADPEVVRSAIDDWLNANMDRVRGPAGPRGQDGADGSAGQPGRSVTQEQIEAVVNAWLESNRDAIRGAAGPAGRDGRNGTDGHPGMLTDADRQQIVDDVMLAVRPLIDQAIAERPDSSIPPDSTPDSERKRLLYFTSTKGCGECARIDDMVRKLKDRGYPITIIDLDPRETEVKGVPRVYHPSTGRDVRGPIACADYLASVSF